VTIKSRQDKSKPTKKPPTIKKYGAVASKGGYLLLTLLKMVKPGYIFRGKQPTFSHQTPLFIEEL
jgi:hypothetical protein